MAQQVFFRPPKYLPRTLLRQGLRRTDSTLFPPVSIVGLAVEERAFFAGKPFAHKGFPEPFIPLDRLD